LNSISIFLETLLSHNSRKSEDGYSRRPRLFERAGCRIARASRRQDIIDEQYRSSFDHARAHDFESPLDRSSTIHSVEASSVTLGALDSNE
jgi:hypothetical protein